MLEVLCYRHIHVVRDDYAVSDHGMRLFGVLDLETTFDEAHFSLGIRNANDKSMRLALTVSFRVFGARYRKPSNWSGLPNTASGRCNRQPFL